ncbi:THAP domain-containing protein 4 [Chionoecetes opilio]|uniref:THAP domain-containing protein 4 n=1 Tax=Chionoecetes opilio TaxID=41210 RepID=A0A8J4XKH1_CHIOP|nr:THAP domain-containing protein 4 [Chionoecetes opilio]
MPSMCCVPNCNGNYKKGPRVSIFCFPRDKVLASQWLRAIKRDNFSPTASSRVCELHFTEDDFRREASATDAQTGIRVTAHTEETRSAS